MRYLSMLLIAVVLAVLCVQPARACPPAVGFASVGCAQQFAVQQQVVAVPTCQPQFVGVNAFASPFVSVGGFGFNSFGFGGGFGFHRGVAVGVGGFGTRVHVGPFGGVHVHAGFGF